MIRIFQHWIKLLVFYEVCVFIVLANFTDRTRRHRVVLFTDDESSTTDDESGYAKKRSSSDAAVIVTDESDSDTDNGAQNAGENELFYNDNYPQRESLDLSSSV